jgi:hypothetical protein
MSRFSCLHCSTICLLIFGTVALADDATKEVPPPEGAIVLFNGKDLTGWVTKDGKPAPWIVRDGYMEIVPAARKDIMTEQKFGDFQLHLEFWIPLMADKKGQSRGNSGVYLQGRHEIQILDSYHNETYANGSCGALYGLIAPSQNASKPPEEWQTYDITYHAPRVDAAGKVTEKGRVTVVHNGITVIKDGEFDRMVDERKDPKIGSPGPILLQGDHGSKVRFRNIWIKPL